MGSTICAVSTALGSGAISIIRCSGKEAIKIVNSIFSGANLEKVPSHTIHYGYISYHVVSCYSAFGFLIFHGQFARLAYTPKFFRQKGLNPKNTKSDKRISEKKFILSLFIYKACNTGYKLLLKLPY